MDTVTLLLVVFCMTLVVASVIAWRTGNETRDIGLLAGLAGLFGAGGMVSLAL